MSDKTFDFGSYAHMNRRALQTVQDAELKFYKNYAETMASELEGMVDALRRGEAVIVHGMSIRQEPKDQPKPPEIS